MKKKFFLNAIFVCLALASVSLIAEYFTRMNLNREGLYNLTRIKTQSAQGLHMRVIGHRATKLGGDVHNASYSIDGDAIVINAYQTGEPFYTIRALLVLPSVPFDIQFDMPRGVNRVLLGKNRKEIWPNDVYQPVTED